MKYYITQAGRDLLKEAEDKPKLTAAQRAANKRERAKLTDLGRDQRAKGRHAVAIDTFNRVEALRDPK